MNTLDYFQHIVKLINCHLSDDDFECSDCALDEFDCCINIDFEINTLPRLKDKESFISVDELLDLL